MDADLQDPPEVVEEMYQKFLSGADVVHATRTERDGETKFKILLTALAYRIINFFSEIELPVDTGDFKLLSRRAIEEILKVKEYDPYMRGLAVWVGLNQNFVLYKREARHSGTSQWPLLSKGPITEFVRGLTAYSAAPLYFAFVVGLFMNLLAVALIGYAIITKIAGISAQGASGTIIVVSLFCGTILMTNGIIGVYLAKIYYQVKGRPPFIVKQVIENQLVSSPLKSS
jgi:dolichol-phosphate mannosyltransferase